MAKRAVQTSGDVSINTAEKKTKHRIRRSVDCCVCCGAVIPEGRQVCPNCERVTK